MITDYNCGNPRVLVYKHGTASVPDEPPIAPTIEAD
jgi:hypothetical protein